MLTVQGVVAPATVAVSAPVMANVAVVAVRVVAFRVLHPEIVTPSPSDEFPSASVSTPIEALKSPVIVAVVEVKVASFEFTANSVVPLESVPPDTLVLTSVILNVPALKLTVLAPPVVN
jgi:hypothetical protein